MLWLSPKRVVYAPVRSFDRIRVFSPALSPLARGELLGASDATLEGGRLLALSAPYVLEASPPAGRLRVLTRLPSPVVWAVEPVANGPVVEDGSPAGPPPGGSGTIG